MKPIVASLLFILCAPFCSAQVLPWLLPGQGGVTCNTPTGTTFTESFGDSSTSNSWGNGTNAAWAATIGTGGSASIVASPAGAPANTACANSLSLVTGTTNTFIQTVGYTPTVPAATAFTVTLQVYVTATSLGAFNREVLYAPSADSSAVNIPCRLDWHNNSPNLVINAENAASAVSGDTGTVSLNTWHTVQLVDSGTTCLASLDGVNTTTVAVSSNSWIYQAVGDIAGTTQSVSYNIGYEDVSVTGITGSTTPPFAYMDAENGSNTNPLSTTILGNATHAGNGTWGAESGSGTHGAMTISTDFNLTLHNGSVTVAGTSYTDIGTRSVKFNLATSTADYFPYVWATNSNTAEVFYWFHTDVPANDTTDFVSMGPIPNVAGSDFVSTMLNSGCLYLETNLNPNGNPDVGSKYCGYTAGTTYGVDIQFVEWQNASTKHRWRLYDSNCNLLSDQQKLAQSTTPSPPQAFDLGRGGDSGTPANSWYFDNVIMDYATGALGGCR